MKTQFKGFKKMNKIYKISLIAASLVIMSCEIPADLNDNPNEITVSDVDANLFLNGAQLANVIVQVSHMNSCLLYTSPSPRDRQKSRMPSSA